MIKLGENKQRLWSALGGFVTMGMLGFIYTWSMFLLPIEQELGVGRSAVVFNFTLLLTFFPLGIMVAGFCNRIWSVRITYIIGCILFAGGFITVSLTNSLQVMYILCGITGGMAFGIVYNIVLYIANLNFPNNTGLISGLMQSGLGFSTLFWGKGMEFLLNDYGWRTGIRLGGLIILLVTLLASITVKIPQALEDKEKTIYHDPADKSWREIIKEKDFWLFWAARAILVGGGLGLVGNAVPIALENGVNMSQAVFALGILSASNAVGRFLLGFIWDVFGSRRTVLINCLLFIAGYLILIKESLAAWEILGAFILCGLSYGGITTLGVAFSKTYYGVKYFQENYGMTTTATILASFLGPSVTAYCKMTYSTYIPVYYIFSFSGLAALACVYLLTDRGGKPERGNLQKV